MNMFRAFLELDKLNEGFNRQELIDMLKALGKNYKFDKYSSEQLYRMWQRAEMEKADDDFLKDYYKSKKLEKPTCNKCGIRLADNGRCPVCSGSEEDYA